MPRRADRLCHRHRHLDSDCGGWMALESFSAHEVIPGFYEFRPFDGSAPINANVINTRRMRWRVEFRDQQTGQQLRLRERRGATEPFITVAGASAFGVFVSLEPRREFDTDVGPAARNECRVGLERMATARNSANGHDNRQRRGSNSNGSIGHQPSKPILRHIVQQRGQLATEQHSNEHASRATNGSDNLHRPVVSDANERGAGSVNHVRRDDPQ